LIKSAASSMFDGILLLINAADRQCGDGASQVAAYQPAATPRNGTDLLSRLRRR